ncbi:penicillin-binding protein activator [Microbaculum marinum]|uniref:Penicillin-binding protein activator n=1 Tax=Microbaculum marinum TaxID=1764581 RepID=A0AAW9RG29_9HYPH
MFAYLTRAAAAGRRRLRGLAGGMSVAAAALIVGACSQGFESGPPVDPGATATSNAIGTGSIKIALLLPLSATGNAGSTAQALQNSAELALSEIPSADLQLLPIDTRGTPEGASAAAQTAVANGARLVIGPLFAAEVGAVAPITKAARVPVLAFSTDTNVASQGVYLLSFLPETDVNRIVSYAGRQGKRAFAALLPQSAYGSVVEAAFQQSVASSAGRVVTIARYEPGAEAMKAAIAQLATVAGGADPQIDALLIPEGPAVLPALTAELANARIDPRRVQFLGSGQWNEPAVWRLTGLEGGVFPGPNPDGWQAFVAKYQARFGAVPPRPATLAYDAVTLAAALARIGGAGGFTDQALTNPDGFSGIDGIFRFRPNGTSQRGLAILEVQNGSATIRQPAPRSFGAGG